VNERFRKRDALRSLLAAGAALMLIVAPARAEPGPMIQLNPAGESRARFEVVGIEPAALAALAQAEFGPDQWLGLFAVYTVPTDAPATPAEIPILGKYQVSAGTLQFAPRFALERGLVYRARFDPARLPIPTARGATDGSSMVVAEFVLPKKPVTMTTRVIAVFPSRDTLPENLLKFYLHFSGPMSRGLAYEHIHLRDETGKDVPGAFVVVAGELWDPRRERLTLLFDPGRLKTGLKPREEFGPILRQGGTYRLVIDRGCLDGQGQPLEADFQKLFRVGPADAQQPDPATWKMEVPDAGTRLPLAITFPEPLDHAMLGRVFSIHDSAGQPVPGTVAIAAKETLWRFTPEGLWRAGSYRLVVDKELEDLAGNSVGRPFEVDVFEKVDEKPVADTLAIPFQIGSPGP
jgi:hypothetical protein